MGFRFRFSNEEIQNSPDYEILLRIVTERRSFLCKKTSYLDTRLKKLEEKLINKEDLTRCQIKK